MLISNMKMGSKARIIKVSETEPVYRKRLLSMGLLPGTVIEILRIAPLGDPIEIGVRGYALSLRKHEASILELEEV